MLFKLPPPVLNIVEVAANQMNHTIREGSEGPSSSMYIFPLALTSSGLLQQQNPGQQWTTFRIGPHLTILVASVPPTICVYL